MLGCETFVFLFFERACTLRDLGLNIAFGPCIALHCIALRCIEASPMTLIVCCMLFWNSTALSLTPPASHHPLWLCMLLRPSRYFLGWRGGVWAPCAVVFFEVAFWNKSGNPYASPRMRG